MSDSTSIPIWGFAPMPAADDCTGAQAQIPGPEIPAVDGNVVTLNVKNAIPDHTISLEVAGVDLITPSVDPSVSVSPDAAYGLTASITFKAGEGTYLYDSAGDSGRQQAMGLYGAVVAQSATPGQAYGVPVSAQQTLVLSEIDPAFNGNPDGFDMNNWHPSRWLINGKDAPGSGPIIAPPGALLLRYVNAGVDHNTMALLGLHQRMLARDGFKLDNPYDVVSETFPAAETGDALVNIPAAPSGTQFPLYNQNGKPGMTTFLQVP
jgi:FtsP/CotA-like multicopper oxidase with cupredoxin domain